MDKLTKRNHETAQAARTELCRHKFVDVFVPLNRPQCWGKPGDKRRFAIEREDRPRDSRFHIVDYPDETALAEFDYLS